MSATITEVQEVVARQPLGPENEQIKKIAKALAKDPIDVEALRKLSTAEHGFVNNQIRALVWPRLLGLSISESRNHRGLIHKHDEWDQVAKDIDRSLWKYTTGKSRLRDQKREELAAIINAVLSHHPDLRYFQGFHDIASVLLLVTNEHLAFCMLEQLSLHNIRDSMSKTLEPVTKVLRLLFPLLSKIDNQLHNFLVNSGVQPFFALPWVLTWFSHNLDDLSLMARIFDFFLSQHPLMHLYFSASLIVSLKNGVMSGECEYSAVHGFFLTLPQVLPVEQLIQNALKYYNMYPPKKLQQMKYDGEGLHLGDKSCYNIWPYPYMKLKLPSTPLPTKTFGPLIPTSKKKAYSMISGWNWKIKKEDYVHQCLFVMTFVPLVILSYFVFKSVSPPKIISSVAASNQATW